MERHIPELNMPILNTKHWPSVLSYSQQFPNSFNKITWHDGIPRYFGYRDFTDTDYWYMEILHGDAFFLNPIETLVPEETLRRIRDGEVVLVVCHSSEAYHSIIDEIYQYLIVPGAVPATQILLMTNSPDIGKEIDHISKKYAFPPIKAEWIIEFEWCAAELARRTKHLSAAQNVNAVNTLAHPVYQKKFLSFNGQPRRHRILLMGLLSAHDLLSYGHISYNCYIYNSDTAKLPTGLDYYVSMLDWSQSHPDVVDLLTNNAERVSRLESMYLDTSPKTQRSMGGLGDTKKEFYEDTYFSVVTETACFAGCDSKGGETGVGRILSEKTFKAIINRHPFIILGVPKTLELLKELGYKTFSPWIDEGYDGETDDVLRTHMVAKEVKKLAELPDDKLAEFLVFAREIVEHNFNNLKSKTETVSVPLT